MQLVRSLTSNPRSVFLLDGCGAVVTAALLVFLLAPLERHFGMPVFVLRPLAYIAGAFALYSLGCFSLFPTLAARASALLTVIALANSLYCVATLVMLVAHRAHITALGVAYFIGESLIVGTIVALELKTAAEVRRSAVHSVE
jgi:hypothetical protein